MKYLDYYNYGLTHSEDELRTLFYNEIHNGVPTISVNQFVDLCIKLYNKKYILTNSQMVKICDNLDDYLLFYSNFYDENGYLSYRDSVIFSFCLMAYFRSLGYTDYCYDNSYLLKFANDKKKRDEIMLMFKKANKMLNVK